MKHLTKLFIIAPLLLCACSKNTVKRKSNVERISVTDPATETMEPEVNTETASLTITSSDLIDGEWNCDITSSRGSNRTPELSWNAIDGAEEYVIYMIDTSANNWLHWRVSGLTDTHLDPGSQAGEYVGPYPPSGTHTYIIKVYALSAPPLSLPGNFDATNEDDLSFIDEGLANIITSAEISGTFTAQ